MKICMQRLVVLALIVIPSFAFAQTQSVQSAPEQPEQTHATEATIPTVITVDGVPVTDETALLKLRLMIQQAGIFEPIIVIETVVRDRPSSSDAHQVDAFTTIVTASRFVERVISDQSDIRGTVWIGNDPTRRPQAVKVAIPTSWRMALKSLASEPTMDTTGITIGRVTIDDEVVTDPVTMTKLRILVKSARVAETIQLLETSTRIVSRDSHNRMDAFSNIATATKLIENVPSDASRDTMWSGSSALVPDRIKAATVMESWRKAILRLTPKPFVQ